MCVRNARCPLIFKLNRYACTMNMGEMCNNRLRLAPSSPVHSPHTAYKPCNPEGRWAPVK